MFRKDYYCLIAGLREYSLDAEKKGFDAPAIIAEIKEELSARDRRTVELFYTYYDIENIVSLRAGREHFSALGNLSREELQEELVSPSRLPLFLGRVITAFNAADKEGEGTDVSEEVDMEKFHLAWQDYRVSPMGANLQLIFYRDKKNDILVKILLNECEVTLPLNSKMVPYYSWKEVETFLAEVIGKE
ncbi:MAG: DUF2764 family protein [Alistipes inops]